MKNKSFKNIFAAIFLLLPVISWAQEEVALEEPVETVYSLTVFDYMLFISAGLVILFVMYSLITALKLWVRMREIEIYEKNGLDAFLKEKEANDQSWLGGIYRQLTGAVPIEREKDILMSHNYDGIQELDNNLPPWWLYSFYLSIGIAIFYMGFYHLSDSAKSTTELYEMEMVDAQKKVDAYISRQANSVDENTVTALTEAEDIAAGKLIFDELCVACHLASGAGNAVSVGPNLTDEYWLHGGGIKNIFKTVKHGVPEKGMIAWKTQMRPADMHKVSSYILTLQGTNPPDGKEPQGEIWVAEVVEESAPEEPATEN